MPSVTIIVEWETKINFPIRVRGLGNDHLHVMVQGTDVEICLHDNEGVVLYQEGDGVAMVKKKSGPWDNADDTEWKDRWLGWHNLVTNLQVGARPNRIVNALLRYYTQGGLPESVCSDATAVQHLRQIATGAVAIADLGRSGMDNILSALESR
jgi:hypothetical protein